MSDITRLVKLLEDAFDGEPWYGNSIRKTLEGITTEMMTHRHGGTHTIIELILHMISWRVYVIKRLQGDDSFKVSDEFNFPKTGTWDDAVNALRINQKELVTTIKSFPETKLDELVPNAWNTYSYFTLIMGSIQHDIYHQGQIAYIKASLAKS